MKETDYRWFEIENEPSTNFHEYLRLACVGPDMQVYAPIEFLTIAGVCKSEYDCYLCATHDNEPVIITEGHYYADTDWIASQDIRLKDLCDKIKSNVLSVLNDDLNNGDEK